jgi:hypothetical protein
VELIVAPVGEAVSGLCGHISRWERSIIMTPFCYRGVRQGRKSATCYPLGMIASILTLITLVWAGMDGISILKSLNYYKGMLYLLFIFTIIYIMPATWTIWRRYPFPREELSEEIFTVLGWENVSDINLSKLNRRRKRQWKRTGKPENPFKDYTPFKCSGMAFGFYYY